MMNSYNQQQLNGRTLSVQEKVAAARAKRAEQEKAAEKIMSKPKRKDTNRPRG
jgi:hypothetical protein